MGKTKKQKGGSSAWSYVYDQVGNGMTQFQNSLTLQPGQNMASQQSNMIEPIGKVNFQNNQGEPTAQNLALIQSAGRRRRRSRSRSRSRKGGNWGATISRAAVPFTLMGMQNTFGKRMSRKNKHRGSKQRGGKQCGKMGGKRSGKMGGNWGATISRAAVPFTLMGMQNTFGKRKSMKKKHRGGNWGTTISRAAVPFTLMGMQNAFGKRKSMKNKSRKH